MRRTIATSAANKKAMTPEQVRGMSVFFDKAKCDKCHEGANFTLNMYANLGVGSDKPEPGRRAVRGDQEAGAIGERSRLRRCARSSTPRRTCTTAV